MYAMAQSKQSFASEPVGQAEDSRIGASAVCPEACWIASFVREIGNYHKQPTRTT